MTVPVSVYSITRRRVLSSRETMESLRKPIREAVRVVQQIICIDFTGVEVVTPSATEQLLRILDDIAFGNGASAVELLAFPVALEGVPLRVFEAHGLQVTRAGKTVILVKQTPTAVAG